MFFIVDADSSYFEEKSGSSERRVISEKSYEYCTVIEVWDIRDHTAPY